ncbi:MAG: hypothetical protein V2I43_03050 [Parvularcula sp.]|nr:hypothetical protein [Parvularcula sp.]
MKSLAVNLGPQTVDRIGKLANPGVSRSEANRISVGSDLRLRKLIIALNAERALTILQHTQFALWLPVERQCPEDVNAPANLAWSNVRECHA